jgi:hypothetical protein
MARFGAEVVRLLFLESILDLHSNDSSRHAATALASGRAEGS